MGMPFGRQVFSYVSDLIRDGLSYEEVMEHCASQHVTLESFQGSPEWKENKKVWEREMKVCKAFYDESEKWLREWETQGLIDLD